MESEFEIDIENEHENETDNEHETTFENAAVYVLCSALDLLLLGFAAVMFDICLCKPGWDHVAKMRSLILW